VRGKCFNPPERLSAHQVYYKTLNITFSAFKQNIKNLLGNFGAIHVGIMHAKFQPSVVDGVGERMGGCQTFLNRTLYKISNLPLRFAWEGYHFLFKHLTKNVFYKHFLVENEFVC